MRELLKKQGLLVFGDKCYLNNFIFERPFCIYASVNCQNVKGGGFSYINSNTELNNVSLGRYCAIAQNVKIGALRHDTSFVMLSNLNNFLGQTSSGSDENFCQSLYEAQVLPELTTINNGVWIGHGVFIPGAHQINIGNGAIIAGNAVVTKDVPPYAVFAGNPGKIIKMRFSDEICADLEQSKWWEYDWGAFISANFKNFNQAKRNFLPEQNPVEFISWYKNGGADLLAPFKMQKELKRIFVESGEFKLQNLD